MFNLYIVIALQVGMFRFLERLSQAATAAENTEWCGTGLLEQTPIPRIAGVGCNELRLSVLPAHSCQQTQQERNKTRQRPRCPCQ